MYIPAGSKDAYIAAEGWCWFRHGTIFEEDIQAISDVTNENISIFQVSDGICIDSPENITVKIYTSSGEKIYENTVDGNLQIPLNTGIYLIKIGESPKNSIKISI